VIFLQHGRIAQQGTHEELLASGGRYAELYRMQAQWYGEGEPGDGTAVAEERQRTS
jgi:ATP-binding cassette subfamily B protein